MFYNRTVKDYIERLSSDQPTPGGGGTSALVGSLAISLILMVARITANRQSVATPQKKLKDLIDHLLRLRNATDAIIDEDPKVFQDLMDSYKQLKKMTNKKVGEANVETALTKSFRVQADLCMDLISAKKLLLQVGELATKSIRNDLIVAHYFLEAAYGGAEATARINVVYMPKGKKRRHHEHELEKARKQFDKIKFE